MYVAIAVVLDVQFSADKFTAALKGFAENDKEQMVNNFLLFLLHLGI